MAQKGYITGANGFLGSRLTAAVTGLASIPHEKISSTKLEPFDYFYFLSTYGNMSFHEESDKIIQANVVDLAKTIDQASKFDFKSFVFISTSSVKLPIQTMYSRTKTAAEEILLAYREKYRLPICIIRPYSITGVGEQEKHLIPTLIRSCMEGEMMNFVPGPTHDFIDVDDVIDGILNLSRSSAGGIFELGSGTKHTNQEVLELVQEVTGKKANINIVPQLRAYDNQEWVSSNYRARGYGWTPKKKLKDSIKEMVKEYDRTTKKGN